MSAKSSDSILADADSPMGLRAEDNESSNVPLAILLSRVTPENRHDEISVGPAVGEENQHMKNGI